MRSLQRVDLLSPDGYSILEAIVASALLASSLVALAHALTVAAAAAARARDMTWATLLASQKVEELRAAASASEPQTHEELIAGRFRRRWTLRMAAGGDAMVVSVEVLPLARNGPPIRLQTIRSLRDAYTP